MKGNKKFQRRIEDFVCEKCGMKTKGNGYTDHCPACLWGKHVDVNPGDRAAGCGGMMESVKAETKGDKILLYYICKECGYEFRVKSLPEDNFEAIIRLVNKPS